MSPAELQVAIVDDNRYTREHMREELDRSPHIAVVFALDQDEALAWSSERWNEVDVAIVDVFDESAPFEPGTDLYSGISVLHRLRALPVRTIALTAHRFHPLVEQRIFESGADHLYHRWQVNDFVELEAAVLAPDPSHRPSSVPASVLRRYGADLAQINLSVITYERSALHGRLEADATHRTVRVTRRTLDAFAEAIRRLGFHAPPPPNTRGVRDRARWPDVRDYLLVLLGRKDVPPTNTDEQADLWRHE